MPARDTYEITATITDEYEDGPRWDFGHVDYLSPGQDEATAMAACLRAAAFDLAPEEGDSRSDVAIFAVLDALRAEILRKHGGDGFRATRQVLLNQLWAVARGLSLEWYGVR